MAEVVVEVARWKKRLIDEQEELGDDSDWVEDDGMTTTMRSSCWN